MTRNPPKLQELQDLFESRVGPYWQGTIGDESHTYGYHLGGDEVPNDDYSMELARDIAGAKKLGGSWASAVDVGMQWPASRLWLRWLINDFRTGKRPDIREIIGSVDGVNTFLWDGPTRGIWEHDYGPHVSHTHISFYRDSLFRDHSYLFDRWTARSMVTVKPKPSPAKAPKPTLTVSTGPTVSDVGALLVEPHALIIAAGAGCLAWVIKRRMERSREDSG